MGMGRRLEEWMEKVLERRKMDNYSSQLEKRSVKCWIKDAENRI